MKDHWTYVSILGHLCRGNLLSADHCLYKMQHTRTLPSALQCSKGIRSNLPDSDRIDSCLGPGNGIACSVSMPSNPDSMAPNEYEKQLLPTKTILGWHECHQHSSQLCDTGNATVRNVGIEAANHTEGPY